MMPASHGARRAAIRPSAHARGGPGAHCRSFEPERSMTAEFTARRIPAPMRPLAAIRAPFLLASLLPVGLGLAGARHAGASIDAGLSVLTLLTAGLLHAGINVINDVVDARNGTDAINVDRVPPFTGGSRMIQDGVYT